MQRNATPNHNITTQPTTRVPASSVQPFVSPVEMVSCFLSLPWLALFLAGFTRLRCSEAFQRNTPMAHRAFDGSSHSAIKVAARSAIKLPVPGRPLLSHPLAARSGEDEGIELVEMAGVVELPGVEESGLPSEPLPMSPSQTDVTAPFLSQRTELDSDALNLNFDDAKQTRVIIYIVLSLLPVLFLIPFMLGSRDLLPLIESADLPPVRM